MNESLKDEIAIREYLLGRVADERELEQFEELLFGDDEFCSLAEIAEDALINDFVLGRLNGRDRADFVKTLDLDADRRSKVAVTREIAARAPQTEMAPSIWDSVRAFFASPLVAGAFALILIAAFGIWIVLRDNRPNDLAELRSIYKTERPVESRIADFDYAPLVVTRGAAEEREKNRLRIIENNLLTAVEREPKSAAAHHALGVFYLTQRKFDDAHRELERAVGLDDRNAVYLNDLGSAFLEKSRQISKTERADLLTSANESFASSLALDPNFAAALFNRSIVLQELGLREKAIESWNRYLTVDSTSRWADEARQRVSQLTSATSNFKTAETVFAETSSAFRAGDADLLWRLYSESKEIVSGVWLPGQLVDRIVEAKGLDDGTTANEALELLSKIGEMEIERNRDRFVSDAAEYCRRLKLGSLSGALRSRKNLAAARRQILERRFDLAGSSLEDALKTARRSGNETDVLLLRFLLAFNLRDRGKLIESHAAFDQLLVSARARSYRFLEVRILNAISEISFKTNDLSNAIRFARQSAQLAVLTGDTLMVEKNVANLGSCYQSVGDAESGLREISALLSAEDRQYESKLQTLRNLWYAASLLRDLGRLRTAIDFGDEALRLSANDDSLVFDSTVELGLTSLELGDVDSAFEYAKRNRAIADSFDDPEAKKLAIADSSLQLAHMQRIAGRCEAAIIEYSNAIDAFRALDGYSVDDYLAKSSRIRCLLRLGLLDQFESSLNEVRDLFERYRQVLENERNRTTFFDREQGIAAIESEFRMDRGDIEGSFDAIESSKARSLLDLVEKKGRYEPGQNAVIFNGSSTPLKLREIQSRMPEAAQLVQYAVFDGRVAAWVVTREKIESAVVQASNAEVADAVRDFLQEVTPEATLAGKANERMYRLLFAKISRLIDPDKLIVFIPDGEFHAVPFAAIRSPETGRYLVEDHSLQYAASATLFVLLTESANRSAGAERLFAAGNPAFSGRMHPRLGDLPAAAREAAEVARMYPESRVLLGDRVTKADFFERLAGANTLHFAGHYEHSTASALYSRLILAQPESSVEESDGEIPGAEILQRGAANLRLVVLSACETGIDRHFRGEGAIGIARTFIAAGAEVVVATGWKVESESTADLMIAFHRNRSEKRMRTVDALRAAQIAQIKDGRSNPYYWAAFSVIGGLSDF
ncbi:MAG: CHAT domain-containing protein [Acidobacteria bacterium]|nr:CHAT domain-containing protein [Acidobacteriota bacterium]